MDTETQARFERIEALQEKQAELLMELTKTLTALVHTIDRQTEAADIRLTRIEQNLDILIRAITTEHGNGKGKL